MTTPHQPQPHTDGIPEDIRITASEIVADWFMNGANRPFVDELAKAILAERNRCISICDAEREWGDFHPDDVTGRVQRGEGPRQIPGWNCAYEED